jgi:hypothetical protein
MMRQAVRESHVKVIGKALPAPAEDSAASVVETLASLLQAVLAWQPKSVRRSK